MDEFAWACRTILCLQYNFLTLLFVWYMYFSVFFINFLSSPPHGHIIKFKNSTPAHKCSQTIHPLTNSSSEMMGVDAPPVAVNHCSGVLSASSNTPSPHIKSSHFTASTCKRRLSIKNRHYMDGKRV